jgi:hypothetical protein
MNPLVKTKKLLSWDKILFFPAGVVGRSLSKQFQMKTPHSDALMGPHAGLSIRFVPSSRLN